MSVETAGYFGPKGRGKTTLALRALARHRRRIVVDLKGAAGSHELAAFGCEVIADGVQLWERLVAAGDDGAFAICWRGFRYEDLEAFERVNRYAWQLGNLALLWDEADGLTGGRLDPKSAAWKLANMSRGAGVSLYFTARRPAYVPRALTQSADRLAAFRTAEPGDVKYLVEFMGHEADAVRELPDWHYVEWLDGRGVAVKKAPKPKIPASAV